MEKEKIVELAENFFEESRQASCYYDITQQYSENIKKYNEEMNVSSAFYSFIYNALVVAFLMELSKIYDGHKDSINIKNLLEICEEHKELFPERQQFSYSLYGKEELWTSAYQHRITERDIYFFQEIFREKEKINSNIAPLAIGGIVNMTVSDYLELFNWRYSIIESKISNLLKQRNKIYAHNDKQSFGKVERVIENFPINFKDAELLLSFALDFSRFVIALLTGIYKADKPVNIEDWSNTLSLVQLGDKYSKSLLKE